MNIDWIDLILKLLIASALGFLVFNFAHVLIHKVSRRSQADALKEYYAQQSASAELISENTETNLNKVRLAFLRMGMDVSGKEELAMYAAFALVGMPTFLALYWLHLGWIISLASGAVLGVILPRALVEGQWGKIRLEIEKEIPTMLRNLSGILKAEPNILEALNSVRQALDPEKPLAAWMGTFLNHLQRQGAGAFPALISEADEISSALSLAVFEIYRMGETGGSGYTAAFYETAENLAEILSVKAQADAKASGSNNMALAIILAAVACLGYILSAPVGKTVYLASPLFKIALVAAIAWGTYGWRYIQQMVQEAVT